jgi:hypothetical protein
MDSKVLILVLFTFLFGCDVRFTGYSEDINGSDAYTDTGYIDTGTNDTVHCEEYRCESYRYLQNPYVYIDRDSGDIYLREYVKEGDRTFILRYDVNGNLIWKRELVYRSKSGEYKPEEGTGCLEVVYVNDDYLQGIVYYGDSYGLGCSGNVAYIIRSELEGDKYVRKWGFGFYPVLMPSISFISLDEESNVYVVGVYERDLELRGIVLHNKSKCIDQGPNGWKCLRDIFVFKFDRDGNILWAKGIGGEGDEGSESIYISNDGLILSVYADSEDIYIDENKMTMKDGDVMIVKLDKNGVYKWSKIMGERSGVTGGAGLGGTDREGNIYIYGYFDLPSDYSEADKNKGLIIAKYDQNGGFIWGRKFEGIQRKDVILKDVDVNNIFISNDSVFTLGNIYVLDAQGHFTELHGKFLSKYNMSGDRIWYREFWDDKYSYSIKDIEGYYNGTLYLLFSIKPEYTKVFDNCVIVSSTNQNDFLLRFVSERCSSVEEDK